MRRVRAARTTWVRALWLGREMRYASASPPGALLPEPDAPPSDSRSQGWGNASGLRVTETEPDVFTTTAPGTAVGVRPLQLPYRMIAIGPLTIARACAARRAGAERARSHAGCDGARTSLTR